MQYSGRSVKSDVEENDYDVVPEYYEREKVFSDGKADYFILILKFFDLVFVNVFIYIFFTVNCYLILITVRRFFSIYFCT